MAIRFGLPPDRVRTVLGRLEAVGRLVRGEFRPDGQEREWCDVEVLRQLRRRSLATFRRQIEPVGADALARFLPAWHGLDRPGRGHDALWRAVNQLQGAALPASVLETDLLPARVRDFAPADLDALTASGDLVWVGAGPLGSADGRVRLLFRQQAAALVDGDDEDLPHGPLHDAIRAVLAQRGALFWPDIVAAGGGATVDEVLTALWDLVWSGEVTNDTLAPLRGLLRGSSGRRRAARARPRPGQLRVSGPPSAAGRWSLTAALLEPRPPPTESAHLRASVLVERHGVLTREAALAEGVRGGFASVYPVLRALEDRGQVRRGYFVAGLGGAQFASLGAIDRLREHRDPPDTPGAMALAATDPAQPYGATLPWPASAGRPARSAGAYVVLIDGAPALFLERGGRSLATFASTVDTADAWIGPLQGLVKDGRLRAIELARIDGEPAAASPVAELLLGHGFTQGYRGVTFRA